MTDDGLLGRAELERAFSALGDRLVRRGVVALLVAMVSATLMVVDHLFGGLVSILTAGVLAGLASWLWFVQPSLHRYNGI